MDNLLMYLFQSQLSLVLLFLLYKLVLQKIPSFKYNRFYLLISVLSSVLIPLIDFSFINSNSVYYVYLPDIDVGITKSSDNTALVFNTANIVLLVYVFISSLLIGKLVWDLISIFRIKRSSRIEFSNYHNVEIISNSIQNFSFFKWIFIRKEDRNNKAVIEHEKAHSRLFHSLDIIIIKIFQSVLWFNPLVFIIEKELRLQHEYEVDQWVLQRHSSILDYQQMLLNQIFQTEFNLVTNNFNQSFLKDRFTMMTKKENKKRKPLLFVALFAASILTPILFSCSMESKEEDKALVPIEENKKSEVVSKEEVAETDELFVVVEEMPQFPGGNKAMFEYIGNNIEYPKAAKTEGIQGRVIVEFVVEKNGKITNVEVKQGIGHGCDEAAREVIAGMPDWSPGKQSGKSVRVRFAVPINFKLQ